MCIYAYPCGFVMGPSRVSTTFAPPPSICGPYQRRVQLWVHSLGFSTPPGATACMSCLAELQSTGSTYVYVTPALCPIGVQAAWAPRVRLQHSMIYLPSCRRSKGFQHTLLLHAPPSPCSLAYQTPPAHGLEDIVPLFAALEAACKGISMLVQRAAIAGATGAATGGGQNAGGDQQKKLDVVSNDLLKGFLARSGVVRVLASEEVIFLCEFFLFVRLRLVVGAHVCEGSDDFLCYVRSYEQHTK